MLATVVLAPFLTSAFAFAQAPVLGPIVYGNGPEKVLVLHDWMGNSSNYNAAIPYLDTSTFTYVFADVRGYGNSRQLEGKYTVEEVASDAFHLADTLGWDRFHLIGHSMTGMVVQRMAIDDWQSGRKQLKSVVAVTPVAANGVALDEETAEFMRSVIHNPEPTAQYASLITGGHATSSFSRIMAERQMTENNKDAMHGYMKMWSETDFSGDAAAAKVGTPIRVIVGGLDLPVFSKENYNQTLAVWYPNVHFRVIKDAGHYVMVETPLFFASLVEEFLRQHVMTGGEGTTEGEGQASGGD